MTYFRSIKRFILISLALLGLSVSSANASLKSGFDPIFGADSITIDSETGLEWLDLSWSVGFGYDEITNDPIIAPRFDGWRYATRAEVAAFWTNGGGGQFPQFGTSDAWVADVLGFWGTTFGTEEAFFLTGDSESTGDYIFGWLAGPDATGDGYSAYVDYGWIGEKEPLRYIGSALVRNTAVPPVTAVPVAVTAVPVPAAVWLFGTALIGLVGFGKRRRAA